MTAAAQRRRPARRRALRFSVIGLAVVVAVVAALWLTTPWLTSPWFASPGSLGPHAIPQAAAPGPQEHAERTLHEGDLTIRHAGTVIDGLDIRGFVRVEARDVTIRNSIIRGRETEAPATLLYAGTGQSAGLRVIDSEIAPTHHSRTTNGVYGYDFTLTRVDIRDVVDAVHIFGDNVTIEDSTLRDNLHYASESSDGSGFDSGFAEPSHDDGIQIQRGRGIRIIDNVISGAHNAAIQITQDRGVVRNVTIAGNTLSDGGCTINVAEKARGPIGKLRITDNRFGESRFGCSMLIPPSTRAQIAGNDSLTPDPVRIDRREQ